MISKLARKLLLRQFRAPRLAHRRTPESLGLSAETIRIPTADGGYLFGWWIKSIGEDTSLPKPAVIVLHGWGANASLMLDMAPWIHSEGMHALFIDARCHGESSDAQFTSMPRFAEDLETARAWVQQRDDVDSMRIFAIGHSVGAGAVLLSANRSKWAGVVSLSAFAHPIDMMQRFLREHHIPRWFIEPWIMQQVQQVIGFSFEDIAPENTVCKIQCPVMLIHGENDRDVPLTEAQRVMQNAPHGTRMIVLPSIGHDLRPAMGTLAAEVSVFMKNTAN